jgi:hypothetical protein
VPGVVSTTGPGIFAPLHVGTIDPCGA